MQNKESARTNSILGGEREEGEEKKKGEERSRPEIVMHFEGSEQSESEYSRREGE